MKSHSPVSLVREYWFPLGVLLLVLLKHSILAEQPFVARSGAMHDDTLFITQARFILSGEWLGNYNQLTLLRGPFYPLWISFVYLLGIPLIHANDLLYLGACLLTLWALSPFTRSRGLLFGLFALLYFAPHSYNYMTVSHGFRMQIQPTLALLVFSAALGLGIRLVYKCGKPLPWALALGLFFSCFWFTREEGLWAVPGLILLATLTIILLVTRYSWPQFFSGIFYCGIVPGLIFLLCTSGLKSINQHVYGVGVIRDIKAAPFKRPYDALMRIRPENYRHTIPVPRQTLQELYGLSPRMAKLQPYLEKRADGLSFNGEIPAAILIFALRDAASAAGYFNGNAADTLAFFDGLGEELESLCREERVPCTNLLLSMVPPWRFEYSVSLPRAFLNQWQLMVRFPEFNVRFDGIYSQADSHFLYDTGRLTHSIPRVVRLGQWDTLFPNRVKEIKLETGRTIGNAHQMIRPILFIVALLGWLYFSVSDLRNRRLSFLNCYMAALLVGLSALATALAIIEVTSFHMLFRPRHGGLPLVSLFICCALVEWRRRRLAAASPYTA